MSFSGVVIEESLADTSVLDAVAIVSTRIAPVTPGHRTPWLSQWTLHTIEIPDDRAPATAELLSRALHPQYWYADFKDDETHYIVFPARVFVVDRTTPGQYDAAIAHGLRLGIPEYQLDFTPAIREWERPST